MGDEVVEMEKEINSMNALLLDAVIVWNLEQFRV